MVCLANIILKSVQKRIIFGQFVMHINNKAYPKTEIGFIVKNVN